MDAHTLKCSTRLNHLTELTRSGIRMCLILALTNISRPIHRDCQSVLYFPTCRLIFQKYFRRFPGNYGQTHNSGTHSRHRFPHTHIDRTRTCTVHVHILNIGAICLRASNVRPPSIPASTPPPVRDSLRAACRQSVSELICPSPNIFRSMDSAKMRAHMKQRVR